MQLIHCSCFLLRPVEDYKWEALILQTMGILLFSCNIYSCYILSRNTVYIILDVHYHALYNGWCMVQFYWSTTPLSFVLAQALQPKYYINGYIYLLLMLYTAIIAVTILPLLQVLSLLSLSLAHFLALLKIMDTTVQKHFWVI